MPNLFESYFIGSWPERPQLILSRGDFLHHAMTIQSDYLTISLLTRPSRSLAALAAARLGAATILPASGRLNAAEVLNLPVRN